MCFLPVVCLFSLGPPSCCHSAHDNLGKILQGQNMVAYSLILVNPCTIWHVGTFQQMSVILIKDTLEEGRLYSHRLSCVSSPSFSQLAGFFRACVDVAFVGPDSCFQRLARIAAGPVVISQGLSGGIVLPLFGIPERNTLSFVYQRCLYFSWMENKNTRNH